MNPTVITLFFYAIFAVAMFFLHVILAVGVNSDAKLQVANKRGLFVFGPGIWTLIVFLTGLFGVVVYWAIHHSTLRPRSDDSTE